MEEFKGYIPDNDSQVLKLGDMRLYSFLMMLGMLCAILTVFWFWRREKYKFELFVTVVIITLPTSILGARLFFIFERMSVGDWIFLKSNWYKIWEGGLSIQGGVVVSAICDLIFLSFKRDLVDLKKCFSIILPTVFIGQAIGRWGNFANHEVYGKVVDANDWSIAFLPSFIKEQMYIFAPANGSAESISAYRAPLFFYESVANLLGYVVLVWVLNKWNWLRPGTTGGLYWVYYGTVRFSMENLREESFTFYNVLSIIYIVVGVLLVIWFNFTRNTRYTVYKVPNFENPKWAKIFYFIVWEDSIHYINRRNQEKQRMKILKEKQNNVQNIGVN
ncbi:prolipoprotein diacylglyceryl transferase [[Mycoplasma] gypis]|uniref:Phosphatidylglycerol--prolipoprotein diacylglyceryl transferase n=1 Tax=[Mycoplasma] gypis TaxID=92404 RepID=A0ABZ2RNF9_9BACT|nr:prolipoprotein diacylglyceryl transferase [[Mycoplasma] gypis]MBN0919012.1 prolipoprotein diacylglyceryl transferase [[Mycoplasma] gypis]